MTKITNDEILNMPAGEEMDKLVAEMVMEVSIDHLPTVYEEGYTEDGKDGWGGFVCPKCRRPSDILDEPCTKYYSTDISAAWEVVKHFTGEDCRDKDFFIECWGDGEWFVAFHPLGHSSREPQASCDGRKTGSPSAPLAICRATLLAVLEEKNE